MSPGTNLYWSIRRELWENRWLYVAPLALAALVVVGFAFHAGQFAAMVPTLEGGDARKQVVRAVLPFGLAAAMLLFVTWIFGVFYSLDALNGERRDRSILFWKSMPVSDLETVLAKAAIPLVVLPVVACLAAWAAQAGMLVVVAVALAVKGIDAGPLWSRLPFFGMPLGMVYGMAVHTLWFAPVFAYVLMVSAWARRAPFLWVLLPFFGAFALETLAFGTQHVLQLVKFRFVGAMGLAFRTATPNEPIIDPSQLDPLRFLASPSLWIGLAFAAAFLAAAVRLRRYRDPT